MSSVIPNEQSAFGRASAVLEEVLHGIRTVMAFNGQEKEIKRYFFYSSFAKIFSYETELEKAAHFGIRKGILTASGSAVIYSCLFVGMAIAFWYGTHLVVAGEITAGVLFATFWAIVNGAFAIGQGAPQLAVLSGALVAAKPILDVIDRIPDIDASSERGHILSKVQ